MITSETLRLILATLAVYRVSVLISKDYGPGFIFERLRLKIDALAKTQQDNGKIYGFWQGVNEGINCPYCVGIWVGILSAILLVYPTALGNIILFTFGLAGAQSLLQQVMTGERL